MSFFLYFATLKQIEGKIFKHIRVKGMKMRKEKKSPKRWMCVASRAELGCWSGGGER